MNRLIQNIVNQIAYLEELRRKPPMFVGGKHVISLEDIDMYIASSRDVLEHLQAKKKTIIDEILDWQVLAAMEAMLMVDRSSEFPQITVTRELLDKHRNKAKAKLEELL